MARPKKPPEERRDGRPIVVAVTDGEREALREAAGEKGIAPFVRTAALEKARRKKKARTEDK